MQRRTAPQYDMLTRRIQIEQETLPDFEFVVSSLRTASGVAPDEIERFESSLQRARRTFGALAPRADRVFKAVSRFCKRLLPEPERNGWPEAYCPLGLW